MSPFGCIFRSGEGDGDISEEGDAVADGLGVIRSGGF